MGRSLPILAAQLLLGTCGAAMASPAFCAPGERLGALPTAFDPEALERGAKALREISASKEAGKVRDKRGGGCASIARQRHSASPHAPPSSRCWTLRKRRRLRARRS